MSAPKPAIEARAITGTVRLSEARMPRGRFLANVITGGVLAVLAAGFLIVGTVLS